jgi:hypothetical protein
MSLIGRPNLEVVGLAAEVIGLMILLLTALWQASVTDWFDTLPAQSQYFIQETANLAVLQALGKSARALNESDPERRRAYVDEVDDVTRKAMSRLVEDRTRTDAVLKSQGSWLKLVRHSLFVIGATLVVVGKTLVLRHKYVLASRPT